MVVYGEYLFAENFIAGLVLLSLTEKWSGKKTSSRWLVIGAVLCACYSFSLFLTMNIVVEIFTKILFSFLIVGMVFFRGTKEWKKIKTSYIKTVIIFYTSSFMTGGCAFALIYFTGTIGAAGTGGFYIADVTYLKVMISLAVAYFIGIFAYNQICKRIRINKFSVKVRIEMGEKKWSGTGFIDTGNNLKEPISGKPVHIISLSAAKCIFENENKSKYVAIPYKTIGRPEGILNGYKVDRLVVDNIEKENAVIAIGKRDFAGEYDILLNNTIMEVEDD